MCCRHNVDIAEVVLLWRRLHRGHDMLRCACVLLLCVFACLVAAVMDSMISVGFLLLNYYFSGHVALNGCNVFLLNEAIIFPNRADFYVPPSMDAVSSAFV